MLETRASENSTASVGATSVELFKAVPTRTFFYIYNGTAGSTLTLLLGDGDAILNEGVILAYGQAYTQSDGEGFRAWRGRIAGVASGACVVSKQSMLGGA